MNPQSTSTPFISVIVPTRNRARSLRRTLEALARQTYPADSFELLVIANDCSDETGAMVRTLATPYALQLIESTTPGMSLARNTGASMARGDLLVFVDDDIEPLPGFLSAYARGHDFAEKLVAVGPLLSPPLRARWSFLAERLFNLEADFSILRAAETEPLDWTCMAGGNVAIPKALFQKTGGFDVSIVGYGGEDYEFGYRAQKAGAGFVFLPDAGGYHYAHENTSLATYLQRARAKGRNDVGVTRRHPEMVDRLALGRATQQQSMLGSLGRSLAFDYPAFGDPIAHGLLLGGQILVWFRLRRAWNRLLDYVYSYWYFRGVADALGNGASVREYLADLKRVAGKDAHAESRKA